MNITQTAVGKVRRALAADSNADNCGADRGTQLGLSLNWQQHPGLDFRDVEFRNYSQNGEDGILLYLFSLAGHGARRAVELCAGDGVECNTANLVIHHDWDALMLDGNTELVRRGKDFYARHQETSRIGPTLAAEWITTSNVNEVLRGHGYDEDIDLLSLDMDGVDFWILTAIDLRPRVIVVEYNNRIPADRNVTVPYEAEFAAAGGALQGDGFFGASIGAFDKLLTGRGYRLVGANRHNTNAFFLREDVLPERGPRPVESCLTSRWAKHQRRQWQGIAARPWVEV